MITGTSPLARKTANRTRPSVLTDQPPFFINKAFYRVYEVAEILGVGEDTVRRLAQRKEFGEVIEVRSQQKDKRRWIMLLIPRQGLLSFLERHKRGGRR